MDDWDNLREELLEDPATRAAYEARRPAYELASNLVELRTRLGRSQRQTGVQGAYDPARGGFTFLRGCASIAVRRHAGHADHRE